MDFSSVSATSFTAISGLEERKSDQGPSLKKQKVEVVDNINKLPKEIILLVLEKLEINNFSSASKVCKLWNSILNSSYFFQHQFTKYNLNVENEKKISEVFKGYYSLQNKMFSSKYVPIDNIKDVKKGLRDNTECVPLILWPGVRPKTFVSIKDGLIKTIFSDTLYHFDLKGQKIKEYKLPNSFDVEYTSAILDHDILIVESKAVNNEFLRAFSLVETDENNEAKQLWEYELKVDHFFGTSFGENFELAVLRSYPSRVLHILDARTGNIIDRFDLLESFPYGSLEIKRISIIWNKEYVLLSLNCDKKFKLGFGFEKELKEVVLLNRRDKSRMLLAKGDNLEYTLTKDYLVCIEKRSNGRQFVYNQILGTELKKTVEILVPWHLNNSNGFDERVCEYGHVHNNIESNDLLIYSTRYRVPDNLLLLSFNEDNEPSVTSECPGTQVDFVKYSNNNLSVTRPPFFKELKPRDYFIENNLCFIPMKTGRDFLPPVQTVDSIYVIEPSSGRTKALNIKEVPMFLAPAEFRNGNLIQYSYSNGLFLTVSKTYI